jgi:hypothetical protein
MTADREYVHVLEYLYEKSLVLHDPSLWDPVLRFYFLDALAHVDYTVGLLAYGYQSPKTMMSGEYLRWRIDEEKKGDRAKFPGFINWLKQNHPDKFSRIPSLWQQVYDLEDQASYRSFRVVIDPESRTPVPAHHFTRMVDEFFIPDLLKSMYTEDGSLASLFREYCAGK